jgi:predicted porin
VAKHHLLDLGQIKLSFVVFGDLRMKKLLIASAALAMVAGTAQAQSSVTVYGIVDAGITELTTDTTTSGTTTSIKDKTTGNGSAYTSQRLGFRGTEDLGGGLKANFVYEFGLADSDGVAANVDSGTDTANPTATRVATVGLSGSFGSLAIGRQQTIADKAWAAGAVGSQNNFRGSAYQSSDRLSNARSDRLINYISPAFSGFTIHAAMGERNNEATSATTTDRVKETGLGLQYSAGALNAIIGYSKRDNTLNGATVATPEQLVIGANYNFNVARVFVTYAEAEDRSTANAVISDKDVMEIGVAIPFGKTTLQLSMFDGENKPTTTTKQDLSGYQVGVLHALSKRTTAYAVYGADKNETNGQNKTERDTFGFGVRHAF